MCKPEEMTNVELDELAEAVIAEYARRGKLKILKGLVILEGMKQEYCRDASASE
jgi:hypothetical protein